MRLAGLVVVPEDTTTLIPSMQRFSGDAHFLDSDSQLSWVKSSHRDGGQLNTDAFRRGQVPRLEPSGRTLVVVAANNLVSHNLSAQVRVRERFRFAR